MVTEETTEQVMTEQELRALGDEVIVVLLAIERGEVEITPVPGRRPGEASNPEYVCANGWRLVVFDDCGDWDYLEEATAPDGRVWSLSDGVALADEDGQWHRASTYSPSDEVAQRIYGIPGYLMPYKGGNR